MRPVSPSSTGSIARSDGTPFECTVTLIPTKIGKRQIIYTIVRDESEKVRKREQREAELANMVGQFEDKVSNVLAIVQEQAGVLTETAQNLSSSADQTRVRTSEASQQTEASAETARGIANGSGDPVQLDQ